MKALKQDWFTDFFGKKIYIYLAVLASIPIFIGAENYVSTIGIHEDEIMATTVTFILFLGVFTGRYLSRFWISPHKMIPNEYFMGASILLIVCIIWIFAIPFQHQKAITLMFWLPFTLLALTLGFMIKAVRQMARYQTLTAQQDAAQSKSELQLLQSQLSPHFLFNTLNNLYGLSITQHEKVPPLLLKLSDLLRYSVYDTKEVYVPLKEEIAYINNYIDFEKIRLGERLILKTYIEAEAKDSNAKIAPMLLIIFIENAFKHSKNSTEQHIYIEITLKTWANSILFSIKNSFELPTDTPLSIAKNSGFGLTSAKKRLELLYPNAHDLKIDPQNGFYSVMLQLKMQ